MDLTIAIGVAGSRDHQLAQHPDYSVESYLPTRPPSVLQWDSRGPTPKSIVHAKQPFSDKFGPRDLTPPLQPAYSS